MKFWLLDPWDALPGEIGFDRGQQVALALDAAGHEVTWWQTGFAHAEKKIRATTLEARRLGNRSEVVVLPARAYASNVSARRLLSIADYVWAFMQVADDRPKPDAILISGPIFFSEPFLLHLRWHRGIPLVYEFRDLWPETIIHSAKGARRLFRWLLFSGFYGLRRIIFKASDGLIGLNKTYLEIARREAGHRSDQVTVVAYPSPSAARFRTSCPGGTADRIRVISSGTLGASHDHATLLAAAERLKLSHPQIQFLITGAGIYAEDIRREIRERELTNVDFRGALPHEEFVSLLAQCDIGLALYRNFSPVVFPTKVMDYLIAGLAVVTSARGEGGDLLEKHEAGKAIPGEDCRALAETLSAIASDRVALEATKINARKLSVEFDGQKQIARIVETLELVGRRNLDTAEVCV